MKVDAEGDKIIVFSEYREKEKVKGLPTAAPVYHVKKFAHWEAPANEDSFEYLRSITRNFTPRAIALQEALQKHLQAIEYLRAQKDIDIDYDFKIPPLPHQKVDMKFIALFKRCLLGHQTGVGKTFPSLVTF